MPYYGPMQQPGLWGQPVANLTVVDKVPPEIMHLVDPHWSQFPPMNPLWHSIIGFVIFVLGVVSIIGNGMVIYIFSTAKTLRTPSNLFIVNLALSDFLMMGTNAFTMVYNCWFETWSLGLLMCDLYAFFGSLFGCCSIWTMTMIALDRHNVIVRGLSGKPLTNTGAILRILLCWLIGVVWGILPMLGWNRYVPEGNMTACGTDYLTDDWFHKSYILVYSVFVYYTPLFTIIYAYFFIIKAVSAHEKNMREQAKRMNIQSLRSSDDGKSTEMKLAKVALVTISLWFMAWTPYTVINYTGVFKTASITPLATIWGSVFAKANAVYNPIVYGISHPKYRAALLRRFPSLACSDGPPADDKSLASEASGITSAGNPTTA
ncbi:rhodopsin-like [Anopheles merus]|uniref:G-protein coupled receptors family 1 profile domain-containing protein n=2 Tax=gambiae species complex TaxID=44542 RepID=A0A182V6M9_ANOME|nr:rhodopsin-like [Anopheles merus]